MLKKCSFGVLRLSALVFAINQAFSGIAYADQSDADRIADLSKKLDQSMAMIKQLSDRVVELEHAKTVNATNAAATNAAAPAVNTRQATSVPNVDALLKTIEVQNARIEKIEKNVEQEADANANAGNDIGSLGVPMHGFASLGYQQIPNRPNFPDTLNAKSGFAISNLDFYLSPNFGDRLKALFELNDEYTDSGIITFDVERLEFGYTFSDAMTIWAGRFHTPFGVWNTSFHHGHYIQTSETRPRFLAFEDQGGVMPSHTVGVLASGALPAFNDDKFQYDAYVGNGARIVSAGDGNPLGIGLGNQLDFNPVGNDKGSFATGGRASYLFSNGVTLGVHALSEQVNTYDADNNVVNSTDLRFFGGFYFVEMNNWEAIGEYYNFRNNDVSGQPGTVPGLHKSWAAYAQLSYSFDGKWTPYGRLEKAALDQSDNYFASQLSGRAYSRQLIGLRWDFNKKADLKLELTRTSELETTATREYWYDSSVGLQYEVAF